MNQKGFANIIFIVLVIALLGTAGYFVTTKKSELVSPQEVPPSPATTRTLSPSTMTVEVPSPPVKTGDSNQGGKGTSTSTLSTITGFIEGAVMLKFNNPCATATYTEPRLGGCDPIIIITIYKADGKTVAATTQNWNTTHYRVELKPGQYIIYTQNSHSRSDIRAHSATVVSGKTTKLDLVDPITK